MNEHSHEKTEVVKVPANGNGNGNGTNTKLWVLTGLVALLVPLCLALISYVYQQGVSSADASVSSITQRLSADEVQLQGESQDITTIKSDVSFIKGYLQQKFGTNANP